MSRYREVKIYAAHMDLHGLLIFSTEQRPSLAEEGGPLIVTGNVIHNYSLIYGFSDRSVESYAVIPSLHYLSYKDLSEKQRRTISIARSPLRYNFIEEQLRKLLSGEGESVYVFPAIHEKIYPRKVFMQAKGSGYAEFRGALKSNYPRLEHYVALMPPSTFKTVVLTVEKELPKTVFIRIGMKRMGLFKVSLREIVSVKRIRGQRWSSLPVNLYDVELFGYSPVGFIKLLEIRSKPPDKPSSSIIGFIRAEGMFEIESDTGEKLVVPLPLKLFGGAP